MNISDRPQFEAMLDELGDIFNISANRLDSAKRNYFHHLDDAPWPKMRRAMHLAIRTKDSFPSIAMLRQLAGLSNTERCQECIGNGRVEHVKGVFLKHFDEEMQSIDLAVELTYGHCRTNYGDSPYIRLWCKEAICEREGWSHLPIRFQTAEQQAEIQIGLAQLGRMDDE